MLDDIRLFIHIVQAGGLSAAARQLGLPPATVTRRLQKLEHQLGTRLVHRSARQFALTTAGEGYYRGLGSAIGQVEDILQGLSRDLTEMRGPLTLALPTNLSIGPLRHLWAEFHRLHPEIRMTFRLSNALSDLAATQADLAVRVGPMPDSAFRQRRVGTSSTTLLASPGYLSAHGAPAVPEDLSRHSIIAVSALPRWQLVEAATGTARPMELRATLATDDLALAAQLARDGAGIVLLPVSQSHEEVAAGLLAPVLPGWRGQDRPISLVWPSGGAPTARVAALRDFLAERIGAMPWLQGQIPWQQG